ncbi:unnamed protein product, partial [Phaeothamnion confervicola]
KGRQRRGKGEIKMRRTVCEDGKRNARHLQFQLRMAREQAEENQRISNCRLANAAQKEAHFKALLTVVMDGDVLADELGEELALADEALRQKQQKRYEEWNTTVFGAIQGRIDEQLNALDPAELNARRRDDMQRFLDLGNRKKTGVFRDIYVESEYDPFAPNRHAIKAGIRGLKNPCARVLEKAAEEKGLLSAPAGGSHGGGGGGHSGGSYGSGSGGGGTKGRSAADEPELMFAKGGPTGSAAVGRETLDVELWATGRIESTAHGFAAKMLAGDHGADALRRNPNASAVLFEHFNIPCGAAVVSAEFPRGKRTFPRDGPPRTAP